MASEHKPTLQLRHQICGNGITITASAYDTRRHHLLVYDALAQGVTAHTLRLFSLRREIRMTPLFDNENKPLHSNIRQEHSKATVTTEEIAATTITYISLVYSYENDVFVCVYNAFTKPPAPAKGVKKPAAMVVARYNVLFLEPATLKKLVTYPGPMTHDLLCAHFDEASSRLVLASRLRADQVHSRGSVRLLATTGDKSNAIDILHVSKRPFRTSTASAEARIMLCVEKTRQSIAYAEALVCMTATANLQVVYGTGICEYEDEEDDINERPRDSFVLEWRSNEENQLQLTRRIVHADDPITSMIVAEEGGWLFTGHESGQLRVWNMRSENTPSSSWTSTGGRHDSAVSTIQLQSVHAPRNEGCVEVVLFTTERRFGGVRHWQFIASTSVSGPPTVRFECVDALDVAPSDRNSNSPKKIRKKQQLLVDQRRVALLICVSIDMGTFAEKLVLVTRGDMIHVIKVQALLKIVHRVLGEDQVLFMRLHKSEADVSEKTIKWVEAAPTKATNQEPSQYRGPTDVGNSNAVRKRTPKSRSRRHRPSPSVKELMQSTSLDFPDEGLVQRIQISQSFAPLWSNGYCWCAGLSVIVQWDDSETQPQVCEHCRHRRHTLRLLRKDYKPHFTLRMILEVIVDVYESLLPEANAILFNNDAGALTTERLSIHHALFQLFKHRYGIQSIVETKLKLLFVSMCHVVRQVDGVAVFGELLALFVRTDVDEQAPDHIAALCVCAYGWLYSREMVVNGLTLLGRSGGESENVHTSKATHWQFVRLANALFCAQELLRYPLVSPLYLHNIMRFAQDYSQRYPSTPDELTDEMDEGEANPMTRWLEMHRFLRMLVGEWKQQTTAFRSVEQLLFVAPLSSPSTSLKSEALTSILESLRLILSCFVFHDHDRAGVIPVHDFAAILRRLKYLWPNEHLTEQEATRSTRYHDSLTFENAIFAAQKRFRDTERDGRLCYLDFWAMLYIVGVKTASLLKFREIPSFCKDYKLEISHELRDNVVTYMQCASSLLLPRGFQPARSSVNEEAKAEHRRRVGGLHDGMFAMDRTLATRALSVQELLECHGDKTDDSNDLNRAGRMYVDGSLPALRKNASTSVLDASSVAIVKQTRTSPVVVGIRPSGPHPKPVALISASALENDDLPQSDKSSSRVYVHNPISQPSQTDLPVSTQDANALSRSEMSSSSFGNIYIQFPYISPRHTRVECLSMTGVQQRIIGTPTIDEDDETRSWKQHILSEHDAAEAEAERRSLEREQRASATLAQADAARVATKAMATRLHSFSKLVHSPSSSSLSPSKEATSPARSPKEKSALDEAVAPVLALPTTQTAMKSGRKTQREEAVVVIPTIEKESPIGVMSTARRSPVRERTRRSVINNHEVIGHLERPEAASTEDDAFVHDDLQDWSMGGFDGDEALSPAPFEDEAHLEMTTETTQAPVASQANSTPKDSAEDARLEAALSSVETVEPKLGVEVKVVATPVAQEAVKALQNVTLAKPVPDSSVVVAPTVQVPKTQSIDVLESLVNKTHPHETTRVLDVLAEEKDTAPAVIAPAIGLPITKSEPQQAVVVANFQPAPTPTAKPSPPKVTAKPSKKVVSIQPETPAVAKSSQRHQFKFSQQPQFQSSAAINTNPLRARGWSPGDDSASDEEDDYTDEHHRRRRARTRARGDEEDEDDGYDEADNDSIAVEDMQLRLSPKSIASLRRRYNSDPNYKRTKMRPLGAFPPSFTSGTGSVSATNGEESSTEQRGTHLDNDTERALYGEHMTNDLGEGIVFSPEAEKAMQEKWNSIFSQAETTMFSPLKAQIESREAALREQEEQQSRLMKKRLEQQAQDDLRLRRNSILTTANGMGGGDEDPCAPSDTSVNNFRVRRLTREVCFQGQHELQYGTTAGGDLKHVHNAQYYHFLYSPDTHDSILTLRLHVTRGEAEMFVSTETKAPCSSDFMWRSSLAPTISTDPNELHPGQKIVLFPHDHARVLSDAATEGTTSVTFYVSVVALEPRTSFMIGLMASGQTPEASRAVQMVDSLIERFNQLAHSFQSTPSESDRGVALTRRASGLTPSSRVSRLKARLAELQQDTDNEQGDDDDGDASDVKVSTAPSQRNRDQHEQVDEEGETTSFQQLLESMSKRNSVDQDRNAAHSTPWSSQVETSTAREFLEDEVQRLQETQARLSPVKMQTVVALETSSTDVDGVTDAIAAAAHRRLSSGSRRRLARLQQPLSPLKAKAQRAHQQEDGQSASLKVAMYEPKRVAYSLSSLRPREKR
ncbi:hypothetical protein Poli38472_014323 [Pythium oligandrum]|uniref:Uncharacterized protein n=1 Tax=Pythium oligandrum TaxID=41045 RepID=A0A8K1FBX2_PYTOL|nr:hypothetical protein Poli38472_014323 [Pythium oligandrum]|eukprot:TMW57720.1 hypothetical protein Poli38472_014323 [Pythium oligandrum]